MENTIELVLKVNMDLDEYCEFLDNWDKLTQQEKSRTIESDDVITTNVTH